MKSQTSYPGSERKTNNMIHVKHRPKQKVRGGRQRHVKRTHTQRIGMTLILKCH